MSFSDLIIDFTKEKISNLKLTGIRHDSRYKSLILETSFLSKETKVRQRFWHVLNNILEVPKCEICKINYVNWDDKLEKYKKYCSSKCANRDGEIRKKIEATCIERYGTKSPAESLLIKTKIKLTNQERYGVNSTLQLKDIQEKRKKTMMSNYGVDNPSKSEEICLKRKKYFLDTIGVISPLCLSKVQEQITKTNQEKYGVNRPAQKLVDKDSLLKLEDCDWLYNQHVKKEKSILEISKELCVNYSTVYRRFVDFNIDVINFGVSEAEVEIRKFVQSNCPLNIQTNFKLDSRKELDIYIPDLKLAFEYNGLYWHSQSVRPNKNYHLDKSIECYNNSIRLTHIFENEWINQQDIVKSRILNLLGKSNRIFARKCKLVNVKNSTKYDFLEDNHIQGDCVSKINLGLTYEDKLVSIMTFGKSRFNKGYEYELLRFCNIINHTIIGGASRLLKNFIKLYNPKNIISYADLRYSDGNLYNKLGFNYLRRSHPNYWYFKGNDMKLYHRVQFQKHKLESKLNIFDSNLTEYENMLNNGYHRIFDCGNGVYEMIL
ncbi:MAG: hypothetical protein H8D97_00005 [Proteobacteria bacterium]|nr:hypothetical protein [Pseudomonadota bacterium]